MKSTFFTDQKIKRIIRETIKEEAENISTFYVHSSSWFDTHPYDVTKISQAIANAGGENIRTENLYGWGNQPKVVLFDAPNHQSTIEGISKNIAQLLGTDWVIIREKDW